MDRVGVVMIASVNWFGHWRVCVCKCAYTKHDQENTRTYIRTDNWRALEAEAGALMLANFGTIETVNHGLRCPRSLARRATWQAWARANRPRREGKA